MQVETCV